MSTDSHQQKLQGTAANYSLDLSIVIVSYNGVDLLKSCLNSIYQCHTEASFEIIVIDNASQDDVSSMVCENFSQVRFIQNDENLGFSKANNIAINSAKGAFVLILNPDTQLIENGTLDTMLSFMQKNPDVGAAGGNLVYAEGHEQISAGYRLTPVSLFAFSFFLAKITGNKFKGFSLHPSNSNQTECVSVDWICAACMIVRREVIETTGAFDESYFLYGEDIEWGCRMSRDGWKLCHLPFVKIEHVLGGTQKNENQISTVWLDGMARVYYDLNPNASSLFYRLVFGTGLLLRAMLYGSRTIFSKNPWFFQRRRDMTAWAKYVLFDSNPKALK